MNINYKEIESLRNKLEEEKRLALQELEYIYIRLGETDITEKEKSYLLKRYKLIEYSFNNHLELFTKYINIFKENNVKQKVNSLF